MPAKPAAKPAPASVPQAHARTRANALRRIARHQKRHPNWTPGDPTQHRPRPPLERQFVILARELLPLHHGPWYACILDSRILSCGSLNEADSARKQSMDPRAHLIRRDGSILNRIAA